MKKVRKLLTVLLTLTMICSCFIPSFNAFAEQKEVPLIKLEKVIGTVKRTVEVKVSLLNNPGIVNMRFSINYESPLKLISVKDGKILGEALHSTDTGSRPYTLKWQNDLSDVDFTEDGVIATLTFEIPEGTDEGLYEISAFYNNANRDITNANGETVDFAVENGSIRAIGFLVGDVDNSGEVDTVDRMILSRYTAKWDGYGDLISDMRAADTNGDGTVDTIDRMILSRHVARWPEYENALIPYIDETVYVKSVSIVPDFAEDTVFYKGMKGSFSAKVEPRNAYDRTVIWSSDNEACVIIDQNGNFEAVAEGEATITCVSADKAQKSATYHLTVHGDARVEKITVRSSEDFSWYVGKTAKLTADVEPWYAANKNVIWSSSDSRCAKVDINGNVEILKSSTNEITITATALDSSGVTGTYKISINPFKDITGVAFSSAVPDKIFVDGTTLFKPVTNPADASERGFTYTVDDDTVAMVDEKGNVTGLKEGTVTVTATSTYKPTLSVSKRVTVSKFTLSCILSVTSDFYTVGDTLTAYCMTRPSEARSYADCHIEAEDENIVQVIPDSQGFPQIKFKSAGKTRIRAVSENGKIVGSWLSVEAIEKRELRANKDFFEEVKNGNVFNFDVSLYKKDNGEKIPENASKSMIDCYLAPYGDYFNIIETDYGKYEVSVIKELPAEGAYITFKAMNDTLVKRVYFVPYKYRLPAGTKAELLEKIKKCSSDFSKLTYADCTKTLAYSDTNFDKSNSKTDLSITISILGIPTKMSITEFIEWAAKESGESMGTEAGEAESIINETSIENLINGLFTGTKTEETAIYNNKSAPPAVTVDLADVKSIEIKDNGSTYEMKLTLSDMTSAKATSLISSSAYGRTMNVVDDTYIKTKYGDNVYLAGGDFGGTDTTSSLSYKAISQKYTDGYAVFTVSKFTDRVVECEYHYKAGISVENARYNLSSTISSEMLGIPGMSDTVLGIDHTAYFTTNVDATTKYTSIEY